MINRKTKIMVVDDEEAMREVLEMRLQGWGFDVRSACDGLEAQDLALSYDPDIIISDVVMPELSGLDLLRSLKADRADRPVVLVTAQGSIDLAVEAMKQGAQDFVTKPLDYGKLRAILQVAENDLELRRKSQRLLSQLDQGGFGNFVGSSKAMREVYSLIQSLSSTDASVIITGESGTGKELAARTIHQMSSRSTGPFIAVNAAAIPENLMESEILGHEKGAFTGAIGLRAGCFELANRGTLFLDEIAEMPLALQPKLLRVIEDRRVRRVGGSHEFSVDVRVIAATNKKLEEEIARNAFREDLFYRLNVIPFYVPALRERTEDIPILAAHFVKEFCEAYGKKSKTFAPPAAEVLLAYSWPGNVRELKNLVERLVIMCPSPRIEPHHLPPELFRGASKSPQKPYESLHEARSAYEREFVLRKLEEHRWNMTRAAAALGLERSHLYRKMRSLGIAPSKAL